MDRADKESVNMQLLYLVWKHIDNVYNANCIY